MPDEEISHMLKKYGPRTIGNMSGNFVTQLLTTVNTQRTSASDFWFNGPAFFHGGLGRPGGPLGLDGAIRLWIGARSPGSQHHEFCVASKPPAAAGDDGYVRRLALAEGTPHDETENVHSLRRSRTSKEPCRTMPIVLAGRLNALATLHLCLYCCAGDCDSDPIMLACPLRIDSAMRCRHCVTWSCLKTRGQSCARKSQNMQVNTPQSKPLRCRGVSAVHGMSCHWSASGNKHLFLSTCSSWR